MRPDPELQFRFAGPGDAALVHALMQEGFAEYRRFALVSSALRESQDEVRRALVEGGALLVVLDGEPVGCARFLEDGDALVLSRMLVVPRARHRGIGRRLVQRLEQVARERGLVRVKLTARSQQPDNRPYYQGLGYRVVGYSECYGVPDLTTHMEKVLTEAGRGRS